MVLCSVLRKATVVMHTCRARLLQVESTTALYRTACILNVRHDHETTQLLRINSISDR